MNDKTATQMPPRSRVGSDDLETVYAGQEGATPRTIPADDWGIRPTEPSHEIPTPRPGQLRPPEHIRVSTAETVLISREPPLLAWLAVVESPDRREVGAIHPLRPGTTTIGRVPGNDIVITDDSCSAQHAKIRIEKTDDSSEVFVLYDMASTNGTYVGSRETYRNEESKVYRRELRDGDFLLLGETTLVFKKV